MSATELPTVGWIGLGDMGLPMAAHVHRAGHRVLGVDLDPSRVAAAAAAGMEPAPSATAAAEAADIVVTMLRTTAQTEALLLGPGGLAEAADDGDVIDVIVMSTLDPGAMRHLAHATAGRLRLVDAPVSGGVEGARAATLAIMASGPPEAMLRARPLLEIVGGRIFELGPEPGSGQVAKLANQVMMGAAIAGTLEALALARQFGLEEGLVIEAVLAGTGASWVLEHWAMLTGLWGPYVPGNALDILIKDLEALVAGSAPGSVTPVATLALERLIALRTPPGP